MKISIIYVHVDANFINLSTMINLKDIAKSLITLFVKYMLY